MIFTVIWIYAAARHMCSQSEVVYGPPQLTQKVSLHLNCATWKIYRPT